MKNVFWKKRTASKLALFSIALLAVVAVGLLLAGAFTGIATLAVVPVVAWMSDNKFKALSTEELKALDPEQLIKYHEAFIEAKNAEMEAKINAKADQTDINQFKKEIFEALAEQTKALNQSLERQITNTKGADLSEDCVKQAIKDAKESISDYLAGKQSNFKITVKAAEDITFGSSTTGTVIAPFFKTGISRIRKRSTLLLNLVNRIPVGLNQIIYWNEEVAGEGTPAVTAEGVAKPQVQPKYRSQSATLQKIAAFATMSKEIMAEPLLMNAINNRILVDLELAIDAIIIADVITASTAFSAGSSAGTVEHANIYDVIVAANAQLSENFFEANYCMVHPRTIQAIKKEKNKDGDYVVAPFVTNNGTTIDGLILVENAGISEGKMLIMDSSLVDLYVGEEINFEMGYNGEDFKENKKSLVGEAFVKTVVDGNNKKGIIYIDIETAIEALYKAS